MIFARIVIALTLFLSLSNFPLNADEQPIEPTSRLIEHKVKANEQLHLLAGYYLLNCRKWTDIYEWNKDSIKNPNHLDKGQVLKIWVNPVWAPPYDLDKYMVEYRKVRK